MTLGDLVSGLFFTTAYYCVDCVLTSQQIEQYFDKAVAGYITGQRVWERRELGEEQLLLLRQGIEGLLRGNLHWLHLQVDGCGAARNVVNMGLWTNQAQYAHDTQMLLEPPYKINILRLGMLTENNRGVFFSSRVYHFDELVRPQEKPQERGDLFVFPENNYVGNFSELTATGREIDPKVIAVASVDGSMNGKLNNRRN